MIKFLKQQAVPLSFLALCAGAAIAAKIEPEFLVREVLGRLSRDSILVLSLIIPVIAGMGLNFGIVLGAIAGQIGVIIAIDRGWQGLPGLTAAVACAFVISIGMGAAAGRVLNRTPGREMLTGMILSFFVNGLYQLVFIVLVGWVIPVHTPALLQPAGPGEVQVGLRNTIDLAPIAGSLDTPGEEGSAVRRWTSIEVPVFWSKGDPETGVKPPPFRVPVLTFAAVGLMALLLWGLGRTKLGQDLRAVGQNAHIAEVAGIPVSRVRVFAIVFSTAVAALGQCVFLQNFGSLNTYNSHDQVALFAIASLVVGGASVDRATIGQAVVGTILFHSLFVVSPLAGKRLFEDPQIGEYFRVFVAYGVIALSLGLHAWKTRRAAEAQAVLDRAE